MKHCRKNSSVSCPHRHEMPNNLEIDNWTPGVYNDLTFIIMEALKEKKQYCTSCTFFEPTR